ncbi:hypothetical protein QUF90_13685 [Desulfococcaceae bacterium HSG9]|nr:hypothetical protein [Desulfococcaceae bacterium HSG9]
MLIIRNTQNLKMFIVILILVLPATAYGDNISIGRIYPTDKVSIYKHGEKVGEFSSEAPLPNGLLVSCRGKCTVKTDWITLEADDGGQFSITTDEFRRELYIKEGSFKYVLPALQSSNVLRTPCVQGPFLPVPGKENLKGRISVSLLSTEISLLTGTPLIISGPEGEVQIEPRKKALFSCSGPLVTLTITDAIPAGVAGSSINPAVAAGAAGAMIAIPVIADILDNDDMSPIQP